MTYKPADIGSFALRATFRLGMAAWIGLAMGYAFWQRRSAGWTNEAFVVVCTLGAMSAVFGTGVGLWSAIRLRSARHVAATLPAIAAAAVVLWSIHEALARLTR